MPLSPLVSAYSNYIATAADAIQPQLPLGHADRLVSSDAAIKDLTSRRTEDVGRSTSSWKGTAGDEARRRGTKPARTQNYQLRRVAEVAGKLAETSQQRAQNVRLIDRSFRKLASRPEFARPENLSLLKTQAERHAGLATTELDAHRKEARAATQEVRYLAQAAGAQAKGETTTFRVVKPMNLRPGMARLMWEQTGRDYILFPVEPKFPDNKLGWARGVLGHIDLGPGKYVAYEAHLETRRNGQVSAVLKFDAIGVPKGSKLDLTLDFTQEHGQVAPITHTAHLDSKGGVAMDGGALFTQRSQLTGEKFSFTLPSGNSEGVQFSVAPELIGKDRNDIHSNQAASFTMNVIAHLEGGDGGTSETVTDVARDRVADNLAREGLQGVLDRVADWVNSPWTLVK